MSVGGVMWRVDVHRILTYQDGEVREVDTFFHCGEAAYHPVEGSPFTSE
jgi:hypothetical protein